MSKEDKMLLWIGIGATAVFLILCIIDTLYFNGAF